MNLSRSARKTDMANYTLIARINAGNGKFPLVSVQYSKNHRPISIEGATYYLRPTSRGKRTPIRIGKDVAVAHTAMINMDYGRSLERLVVPEAHPQSVVAGTVSRKTVEEAALEYIQRSLLCPSCQFQLALQEALIFERSRMLQESPSLR
jgi:hypothetical protein